MKSIILKRGQLCWLGELYVDGALDSMIHTPFRNFHDAGEVAVWVAKRNPGASVEVEHEHANTMRSLRR